MKKTVMTTTAFAALLLLLLGGAVVRAQEKDADDGCYQAINVASPDWVGKLDAAKNAEQPFVVAAFKVDQTTAWISVHAVQ